MSLTDIATIGSIISSVAVALSLVYLALQVRQAERNQRGQMQQGRADRLCDNLIQLTEPGLAAVWAKGNNAPEALTPAELERYLLLCRVAFTSGEDSFLQHRAGLFDDEAFRSFEANQSAQLAGSRGLRAMWVLIGPLFGPEYRRSVDAVLAKITPQPAIDLQAQWRAALAAEDKR